MTKDPHEYFKKFISTYLTQSDHKNSVNFYKQFKTILLFKGLNKNMY